MPQANQRCILDRLFMFTGRRFRLLIKYSADVHCTIIYISILYAEAVVYATYYYYYYNYY